MEGRGTQQPGSLGVSAGAEVKPLESRLERRANWGQVERGIFVYYLAVHYCHMEICLALR